jgi:glutaredoxin
LTNKCFSFILKIEMKITVYTIKDCAFSKQEKEYLNTNKLVFEEKDLETNKDFLTEMLAISNNFAGTPVTRVEKDDGTIAVLKGFTKAEFDTVFGFVTAEAKPPVEETKPVVETPPAPPVESVSPAPVPVEPTVAPEPPKADEKPLNDLMDKLNSKITPPPVTPPTLSDETAQPATPVSSDQPVPPSADAPAIPDFPAK